MHRIRPLFAAFFMATALAGTLVALPQPASAQAMNVAKPLVAIRFNQSRVYFDQQLYGALAEAAKVKPDVMFDVVSLAPQTGNSSRDEQWIRTASLNTQAVIATMQRMGVPMERLRVMGQQQPGLRYDETHIYVR